PNGRCGGAQTESLDLRFRRNHHPLRRDQDHRRDRARSQACMKNLLCELCELCVEISKRHRKTCFNAKLAKNRKARQEEKVVMNILKQIYPAIAITVVLTVLLGIIYPLVVTGLAQVIFPRQASGSLIEKD